MKKLIIVLAIMMCAFAAQADTKIVKLNMCEQCDEGYCLEPLEYINNFMKDYPKPNTHFTVLNPSVLLINCSDPYADDRLLLQIDYDYVPRTFR